MSPSERLDAHEDMDEDGFDGDPGLAFTLQAVVELALQELGERQVRDIVEATIELDSIGWEN